MEDENDYSATNESANNFMSFLDEQFALSRPFELGPIKDTDIGEDYRTTAPFWHDVIRDHLSSKPALPKAPPVNIPRINTASTSSRSISTGRTRNCSGILNGSHKSTYQSVPHCNRLLGSEDISSVVKQGWSIAKVIRS